ncbi:hypothetical protein [Cupriavidus sp.]|uniref:hypothetical protein n=1 Tax=Cupriavidus sp. TaxID=1873897 RepID=UPI0028BE840B|nr:hypothetical protein [Cupriavidus sp.]
MNTFEQRHQNSIKALHWVHRFGWLRATELGILMWPQHASQQVLGSRLAKQLVERQLVIERRLPEGAGRALVLAAAGVRLLAEIGVGATSGKDIGKELGEHWIPALSWRHDLAAHGVLAALYKNGYEVFPELELRRQVGRIAKLPDGLARKGGDVLWLEVESARKSGPEMRKLAAAVCAVADGAMPPVVDLTPTVPMVAYYADATDERGHQLDHRARVTRAVQGAAKRPTEVMWAACLYRGAGIGKMVLERETLIPDAALAVLRVMDAGGWRPLPDADDVSCATYGGLQAQVWNDDMHGWSCIIVDNSTLDPVGHALQASSISAAKLAAAARIAALRR